MKNRSLEKKNRTFLSRFKEYLEKQTDREFDKNKIKKIKNIMLIRLVPRGSKAFAAEQKIREFKKILEQRYYKNKKVKDCNQTNEFKRQQII